MLLELFAKTGLFLSQTYVLAAVFLIGYLFINEKAFGRALFLVAFTMIYNVYLKSIWKMPLPPLLEGWAFPSGHMHSAFVFWGWLAIEYRKIWYAEITFFALCLMGYGIVYHGYHYPRDIFGAYLFGSLSLLIFYFLQKNPFFTEKPYRLGFLLALFSLCIILFLLPLEARKLHVWQAFGALIGLSMAWSFAYAYATFCCSTKPSLVKTKILSAERIVSGR